MQQILFEIPGIGLPIYGFGGMLFLAFFLCTWWGIHRVKKIGMTSENAQDLAFILFVTGIIGARLFYVLQYRQQFQFDGIVGTIVEFVRIDRGGIVFYGCIMGGLIGFLGFRRIVLRRLGITTWALADVLAPLLALGLAVGRIGCYLNGCCWGQVAVPECQPVPLAGSLAQFPLETALAKDQLVRPGRRDGEPRPQCRAVQTGTGFSVAPTTPAGPAPDPRSVVSAVEPGSEAAAAGLKPGDRLVSVNGKPNDIILFIDGDRGPVERAAESAGARGRLERVKPEMDPGLFGCNRAEAEAGSWTAMIAFDTAAAAAEARRLVEETRPDGKRFTRIIDRYTAIAEDWPRGETRFLLGVERGGQHVDLSFRPKTVTLFPTQLYEFISMVLLIGVLLAYQPFKRHDGQLFVLWMICYGIHRFLNEAIRIEPTYKIGGIDLGLTASQWISVGIVIGGVVLELILRKTQPKIVKPA